MDEMEGIDRMTKQKPATKAELREEIRYLRMIGGQMANLCFNIGQNSRPSDCGKAIAGPTLVAMYDLSKQWDAIDRAEIANA